jgi:uncharacterized repeat protein (TIGR01451 family)
MKKLLALLAVFIFWCGESSAQFVNIPDSNFRNLLRNNYPSCFNDSGFLNTNCAAQVGWSQTLEISNTRIKDLEGLQYFKSVSYLTITGNDSLVSIPSLSSLLLCTQIKITYNRSLTNLPQSLPPELYSIEAGNMPVSFFPVIPDRVAYIDINSLPLTTLPALPVLFLEGLKVNNTSISSLPALPSTLKSLTCDGNNHLGSLPSLPASLTYLSSTQNNLTSLPALPAGLTILQCYQNHLTTLPALPDSLNFLSVSNNNLTDLPSLPNSIYYLECAGNSLTLLPNLPSGLTLLDCSQNLLTSLPGLPVGLETLYFINNNIKCLPFLPARLSRIALDSEDISCLPNKPVLCQIYSQQNTSGNLVLPICNATNNLYQCHSFPVMTGNLFFDNNSNGIKDSSELVKKNLRIDVSNGNFAFTGNDGSFEIFADDTGVFTITPTAPNYYNIVPSSATYNFTTYDTIVSKDYALQANTIKDSLAIKLTAVSRARPGFSFPYWISYENAGTTNLSPNIVFNYDNTNLTYDSSSNAAVVNNGNTLSLSTGSLVPGQQGNFTAYFRVKATAALGDSLFAKATLSDNAVAAADSNQTVIRGSFDPNDKQATPELSPLQIANGTYIDYTIRFQNTGNDTAFNVVISDTLTGELLLNTLELTASSHGCKATVKDNVVYFELLNILLPDSNANEMKSHGFVSFRIKPHPSVPSGSTINNKAAIYFDYNAPVITNTAGTFIKPFTVVPLKLVSFSAIPQTDNSTTLFWNTVNEINTRQFVIEQSTDGTGFNSITNVFAKGKAINNYSANVADANKSFVYYRLKIVHNDGSFAYSPIIKIDRRKNTAGFSILTNPVKDFIIINTTDRTLNNTQAVIINTEGAVVKSFIIKEGSQTLVINDLPNSIYYLRTVNGNSKFLKQ